MTQDLCRDCGSPSEKPLSWRGLCQDCEAAIAEATMPPMFDVEDDDGR